MAKAAGKSIEKRDLPSGDAMMEPPSGAQPTRGEIELRAYELYVERGRVDGSDVQDWLEAESELIAEAALANRGAKALAA
jgi:Protein of unknown function (DUF2934)